MSYNNTPITAKIKRTTKGGITQPLLNVGAPVKMKMSSPAKQTSAQNFSSQYDAQQKAKADQKAKAIKAKKEKDVASYNQKLDSYRSNVLSLDGDIKEVASNKSAYGKAALAAAAGRKSKNIQKFEKNLFDYDTKKNPSLTEGYTAKEYALAKAKGTYKAKTTNTPTTTETTNTTSSGGGGTTTTGRKSYEQAYKDRDQKTYGKMTKAEYIKEAKRQNASKKAGKGWDVKGMGKSTTKKTETAKKTATTTKATTANNKKSTNTKNSKGTEGKKYDLTNVTGSTGYQIKQKAKEIGGKISNAAKIAKAKKLAADAKRKTSKVAKKQAQADAFLATGLLRKAARKQRAADKKKSKAAKKSQAAKAIQPK